MSFIDTASPKKNCDPAVQQDAVLAVIVNYRTPDLVANCLASLVDEVATHPRLSAVVVDNGSQDDSVSRIQLEIRDRQWSTWASVRTSPINVGFSAGVNLGLCALDNHDFVLLLNSDATLCRGAVASLLRAARLHPEVGIIGPRLEDPDGTRQTSAFRWRSPLSELIDAAATGPVTRLFKAADVPLPIPKEPICTPWVSFACALIRRSVIEKIGQLDDGYFMYLEDIDYCRRACEAGWLTLYWPEARVVHLQGRSSSVDELTRRRSRRPAYCYVSRARYFAKFYGRNGLWLANVLWTSGRAVSLLRELLGRRRRMACDREWIDIWTNCWAPLQSSPREH